MGLVKEGEILYAVIAIEHFPDNTPTGYLTLYRDKKKADNYAKKVNVLSYVTAEVKEIKVED